MTPIERRAIEGVVASYIRDISERTAPAGIAREPRDAQPARRSIFAARTKSLRVKPEAA
jgi:hypothetical protein